MGKAPEEPKRRKKGRPSLLDLQKRNLRLQKQQQQQNPTPNSNPNPNPNPNPYLRFPNSTAPRRSTRRNPDPSPPPAAAVDDDDDEDDGDEDGSSSGKRRREKKLRLVHRLPHDPSSDSDSGGKRRIRGKARSPASKATDALPEEPLDSGPTTPLPDKKLLLFILDRLQKKDTYSVFSEPVDPDELPDYLDVIDHPMDFGTVRMKLSSGAYQNLEQFEKDIFLISSNAMTYNAKDTIYYRQARAIQELARKDFENLRQESDDNEPEPKTVRRGRPPSKNTNKWAAGKSAEHAASEFSSDVTLANARESGQRSNLANDLSRKGSSSDKPVVSDICTMSSYGLCNSETCRWISEHKSERNEEYAGSAVKGVSTKYGKKPAVMEENRRNTYNHPLVYSSSMHEPSIFSTFDRERKHLVPVGLHMEYAYARSLARFAANLGPKVWEIASQRIQRGLPPGTKFGRGWVGDTDAPQQSQPRILCYSPPHPPPQPKPLTPMSIDDKPPERPEPLCSNPVVEEGHPSRSSSPATAVSDRSSDDVEGTEPSTGSYEGLFILPSGGPGFRPNSPFQLHQHPIVQQNMNGFNAVGFDPFGQAGKMIRSIRSPESHILEAQMAHGGVLNIASRSNNSFSHQAPRSHLDDERVKVVGNPSTIVPNRPLPDTSHDFHKPWRELSQRKPVSGPPDLNVSFQLPASPASGLVVDSQQQPDLALQL